MRRKGPKLTQKDAADIRKALNNGAKGTDIAKKYGICREYVSDIRRNKYWVDGAYNPSDRDRNRFERARKIREAYNQGRSLEQLSEEFKLSAYTVTEILANRKYVDENYKPALSYQRYRLSDEQIREMRDKFNAGASRKQLAKEYGVSHQYAVRIIGNIVRTDDTYVLDRSRFKLSEDAKEDIYRRYVSGEATIAQLAKEYQRTSVGIYVLISKYRAKIEK